MPGVKKKQKKKQKKWYRVFHSVSNQWLHDKGVGVVSGRKIFL